MRTSCLFHYDLDVATTVRFIGGKTLQDHRDVDSILEYVKPLLPQELYDDLERVLVFGSPGYINAHGSYSQFLKYWQYGNHKSLLKNPDHARKVLNKEDRLEHVLTFPKYLGPFVPHLMSTPQGRPPGDPREV